MDSLPTHTFKVYMLLGLNIAHVFFYIFTGYNSKLCTISFKGKQIHISRFFLNLVMIIL